MSTSPRVLELAAPPPLARELLRAAVARRPSRPGEVPRLEVRVRHFAPEALQLARYREVCGFAADGYLPLPFPQVLVAPLHIALLNHPDFPYRLLGMIHVRNRIHQHRRLPEGTPLSVRTWVEGQREVRQGRELDLHTHVEVEGTLVWSAFTTMLRRLPGAEERSREAKPAGPKAPPEEDVRFAQSRPASWTVPEDTGRRYAKASGDYNPIHLYALTARFFGFPRAIAHGMWTVGRCVAEMGEAAEAPALTLTSEFRRPLLLPSRVLFQTARQDDGVAYRVRAEDGQLHLQGQLTPGAEPPEPRPS
ncbi:MaoC/PaaZ C-terminal domain-containing protein [Pyxidicoccus xibeiensis]|uniref:MaoC/PaaZ C-terminal domain-containing protein n=1 Tax=Pyxidicoccus xibeiensis TaxID=2906759 RepID=UPI0020A777CC|nr:MaoC/PaaZ C-terminal domain-containing protein [Pyxidicoccus xibeiensis]MCP3138828.1 acyl dehydratase [Pyxidicoccus xibeiensis]